MLLLRGELKARWPYSFFFLNYCPRDQELQVTTYSLTGENELRGIAGQVFMDETISDRKQLMENTAMHWHPLQLFKTNESGSDGDVIMFSLPHHNPSTVAAVFWTACSFLICICGSPTRRLLEQSSWDRIRQTCV